MDWVASALLIAGASLTLLASVGVVRMPDLFLRIQTATKATTLGVGFILLSVAIHFPELSVVLRAVAVAAFITLTLPVAAHMLSRAAYFVNVPLWPGTIADELRGHYDRRTHDLTGRSATDNGETDRDTSSRDRSQQ
jgi:multicomponent Na+:H+ antiporter subunit G